MAKEVTIDHVIRLPQVQFNTSFLPTRSAESPHHLMSQEAMLCNRPPLDERSLVREIKPCMILSIRRHIRCVIIL
ncbi:uncharacterized protein M6B38_339345 [Iris pallida]|uniref:Uncharacterized protein n=1 Tax=Iris pallida TaxID=29817 RepID=A0AAX6GXS2_IRIPA|nr:uncharacterized protein M6B38_339345 [Iris pallida]